MHDSGKREQFKTGAVRDTAKGKARVDLISPYAQMRKGQWLRLGAEKYDERNWEKGMKISRCIASLERHIQEYKMGLTNEDHLAAIAVNAEFIMHYEKMIKMGLLPADLDDMPKYEQRAEQPIGTAEKRALWNGEYPTVEHVPEKGWQIRLADGRFLGVYGDSRLEFELAYKEQDTPYYFQTRQQACYYLKTYLETQK